MDYLPQKRATFHAQRWCAIEWTARCAATRAGGSIVHSAGLVASQSRITRTYFAHVLIPKSCGEDLRKGERVYDAINKTSANQLRASIHVFSMEKPDAFASDASVSALCLYELSV